MNIRVATSSVCDGKSNCSTLSSMSSVGRSKPKKPTATARANSCQSHNKASAIMAFSTGSGIGRWFLTGIKECHTFTTRQAAGKALLSAGRTA
eukprot:198899-Amphidinium_carterae.1